jgi:gamma-glutamyltranspeptidase / glutathione hydrolase
MHLRMKSLIKFKTIFGKKSLMPALACFYFLGWTNIKQIYCQQSFFEIKKEAIGKKNMVVTAHPLATEVGIMILRKGGNAIDAAIAVQFALAVVYPRAGNIGGGGFLVYHQDGKGDFSFDFREKAPASSNRDMYLDEKGNVKPGGLSMNGASAAGVPGTVQGMEAAFLKFSKLKNWRLLVQPSVDLAAKGFRLTKKEAASLEEYKEAFDKFNKAPIPHLRKESWKEGDIIKQPELAKTLIRIRNLGAKGFYKGKTAKLIVNTCEKRGGYISMEDLADYQSIERKPLNANYKGYKIISMGPPSSGGIALIQLLKMTEGYPLGKWGFHHPNTIHYMIEAEKRVFADRAKYLGDPDFIKVPVKELLDSNYLSKRMATIVPDLATPNNNIAAGNIVGYESMETTHFSTADQYGGIVSLTTTLNGNYGSKTMVEGGGFFLNNEMDDFSIKAGVPNMYGLVGSKANEIVPGKRMLSSMTPTIITKNGKWVMSVGTPGGSTIITSVYQTILNVLDFNMTPYKAVSAKRFHHQWKPNPVWIENAAFSEEIMATLKMKGHEFEDRGMIGRVEVIQKKPDGTFLGGADPRGDDDVRGE